MGNPFRGLYRIRYLGIIFYSHDLGPFTNQNRRRSVYCGMSYYSNRIAYQGCFRMIHASCRTIIYSTFIAAIQVVWNEMLLWPDDEIIDFTCRFHSGSTMGMYIG